MTNFRISSKKIRGKKRISDVGSCATTRYLTRIIVVLQESEGPLCKTQIVMRSTVHDPRKLMDGLNWLYANGIVIKCNIGSLNCYKINPKFRIIQLEEKYATANTF